MSERVDEDGVVHKRGWDGVYRPKTNLFGGYEKDTAKRNILGQSEASRGFLGSQERSNSGKKLYKRSSDNSNSNFGGAYQVHDYDYSSGFEGTYSRNSKSQGVGLIWIFVVLALGIFLPRFLLFFLAVAMIYRSIQALLNGEIIKAGFYFIVPFCIGLFTIFGSPLLKQFSLNQFVGTDEVSDSTEQPVLLPSTSQNTPLGYVTIVPSSVNLRSGPSIEYEAIKFGYNGDVFPYYEKSEDGKWLLIDPTESIWVADSVVDFEEDPESKPTGEPFAEGIITPSSVNLRSGPGTDFDVVNFGYQGESVPIYGVSEDGYWYLIDTDREIWVAVSVVENDDDLDDLPIYSDKTGNSP